MDTKKSPAQLLDEYIKQVMKDHSGWDSAYRRIALDAFYELILSTDEATRSKVITGSTKAFLKKLTSLDDAENIEIREDLPVDVKAAVGDLLVVIEQVNQANKKGSTQEKEAALAVALVTLTECLSNPHLGQIKIKDQALPDYLMGVVGTDPDECNNVLASTVKPYLADMYAGVPRVQQVKKLLGFK